MSRVLGREGADPKVSRALYIAATQAVLLFGSETWVLMPQMEKALDSFQSRVFSIRDVNPHVSDPKSKTSWVTAM